MKTLKIITEIISETIREAKKAIREELGRVVIILQILLPVLLAVYVDGTIQKLLLSCVWVYVMTVLHRFDRRINRRTEDGMPIPPGRLTVCDSAGFIQYADGMEEEAVIYLDELQEYLRLKGIMKYE